MELLLMSIFLLGLWMNWSFGLHSKPKWINLHALRNLVGFQVTANIINIALHLLLLIPWPFFGFAINPGNFLWTLNPIACRLFTVVEDLVSISCIANAAAIFVTNPETPELKQERKRKLAFCFVLMTFCLGGVCAVSYRELIPLTNLKTLNDPNCPSHHFLILCGQKEMKYSFATFGVFAVILFWCVQHRSSSLFSQSWTTNKIDSFLKWLSISLKWSTICMLTFGVMYIIVYSCGGLLFSATFNRAKLYFDITTVTLSVSLPALLSQIHAGGVAASAVESSF